VPASVVELGGGRGQAVRFLLDAYDGLAVAPGKGPAHGHAVEEILRHYGHDERTQIAGLLHDVLEDTGRSVDDLRAAAGDDVAAMVAALTEEPGIRHYGPRKRALRLRVAAAGRPVVDIALADKIDTLRQALSTGAAVSGRKLAHYRATLEIARSAGAPEQMCGDLDVLLALF
jgi:guanosine-3',5'-bis(diphosphate) 3'-pyrophosphohydrolase